VRAEQRFQADRGEPLGLWRRPQPAPETHSDLRVEAFEYTSRGDRVPGRLLLPPAGDGPFPLVLLQHGSQGSKDAPYMLPVAAPWVRKGAAVASIDFPLHGERTNVKLTELLREGLCVEGEPSPAAEAVLQEFVRQAVIDLQRALDAAQELPRVDARRIAYAGLSLGSIIGATFCASDPRPRAAALALGGGGCFAPRPILFVNASRDERVPRAAAEALYAAAGEPKEILWFDSAHDDLPGRALKAMWLFLQRHLAQIEVPA
jgi:fermentation-respiration switch protein FrsA (DUF1100 family)